MLAWVTLAGGILLLGWCLVLWRSYVRGRQELEELQRFYERMRDRQ